MPRTKRRGKTKAWLRDHVDDPYVQRARKEGYRARAAYKLMEIDERDRLLRPGLTVVDLGAAPGSWSQYAGRRLRGHGRLIALDILPMDPLPGVEVVQGDFTEESVLNAVLDRLGGAQVDLVISDMAPNISGVDVSDQASSVYLAELALDFAETTLKPGGSLLLKVFQGSGFPELRARMQQRFGRLLSRKPKASRSRSREIYLLGRDFRAD